MHPRSSSLSENAHKDHTTKVEECSFWDRSMANSARSRPILDIPDKCISIDTWFLSLTHVAETPEPTTQQVVRKWSDEARISPLEKAPLVPVAIAGQYKRKQAAIAAQGGANNQPGDC